MSTVHAEPTSPAIKYESYVDQRLTSARTRIRLLDLTIVGLVFLGGTLAYALIMALADRVFELPSLVRQAGFGLYACFALGCAVYAVLRVLMQRVNPYYAALQVEHGLPDVKNSVVNWLDLRDRELPAGIKNAVSQRAARELSRADIDHIVNTRRTGWLAALAGVLFLGVVVLFFLSPPQFLSLMKRSFAPFTESIIATRTQLTLVQPEAGDLTVSVGRAVTFAVEVYGRVPEPGREDSVRLRYRYQPTDPYIERPLLQVESSRQWGAVLPAPEVRNGFCYSIAAGDAQTPEYRVLVRSTPLVTDYAATYHFRPYLNRPDVSSNDPNLEGVRGTEVNLLARANRPVREGHLKFIPRAEPAAGEKRREVLVAAERVAEDPHAMRFSLVLLEDGLYQIWFTTQDGESNTDPVPHTVRVTKDDAPRVVLSKPGQAVQLPANGTLPLVGEARDDFGLTRLTLQMQVEGHTQSKPYRPGKSFKFHNGNYPLKLEYKDVLELDKLKQQNGQALQPGMNVEYWLEAADNHDFNEPNVGTSERFKITIAPPDQDQNKQQQQRDQAKNDKQQHDQQQDQQLENEDKNQQQQGDQNQKDQKQDKPNQGDQQSDQKDGAGDGQSDQEKNLNDQKQKLEDAIKDQDNKNPEGSGDDQKDSKDQKGEGKGEPKDAKDQKGDGSQPKDAKDQKGDGSGDPKNANDQKGEGQKDQKDQKGNGAGDAKDQKGDGKNDPKDAKDQKGEGSGDPKNANDQKGEKDQKDQKTDGAKDQKGEQDKDQKGGDASKGQKDSKDQQGERAGDPKDAKDNKGDGNKDPKQPGDNNSGGKPKDDKDQEAGDTGNPQNKKDQKSQGGKDAKDSKDQKGEGTGDPKDAKDKTGDGKSDSKDAKDQKSPGTGDPKKADKPKDDPTASPDAKDGKPGVPKDVKDQKSNASNDAKDAKDKPSDRKVDPKDAKEQKDGTSNDSKDAKDPQSDSPKEPAGSKDKKGDDSKGAKDQKPDPRKDPKAASTQKPDSSKDAKDQKTDAANDPKSAKDQKGESANDPKDGKDQKGDGGKEPKNQGDGKKPDGPISPRNSDSNDQQPGDQKGNDGQDMPKDGQGKVEKSDPNKPGEKNKDARTSGGDAPPTGDRQHPAVDNPNPDTSTTDADPKHQKKAGQLQLEDIRKKVTKDVLKKANMTEEEYADFLKAYEAMLKRKQPGPTEEDKLTDPKATGGGLKNIGGKQLKDIGKDDKTQRNTIALPPPEFRDAYKEFTEKISKQNQPPAKR